ncbi:succinate dehydrogenase, cytochrome b556 subunit [Oleisolibacter albus]|uniref:succinate dehydrogenase, cytochrome b556 subunit n=1 Tax=Oleisolibacter albus TaxID=2171757 RepID=UPI000DF3AE63|nr:succinate dehydrogenase, cytochrome b556 subunit [Oleisolibacter albus]
MTDTPAATTPRTGRQRPLSPHLQVYRLPLPAISSITHRITGIGLTVGTLVLAWWLIAAASGPDAFATVQGFLGSVIGQLLLLGWTWALWYHTLNGIRHLVWDTGKGLELGAAYRGGYISYGGSVALTILTWIAAYAL